MRGTRQTKVNKSLFTRVMEERFSYHFGYLQYEGEGEMKENRNGYWHVDWKHSSIHHKLEHLEITDSHFTGPASQGDELKRGKT